VAHAQFVHLRVHTGFSLAQGAIKIPALIERCIDKKMPAVAVTDTNNMFGCLQFAQNSATQGVQPLHGILLTVRTPKERTDPQDDALVLYAQSLNGYQNLLKLTSLAWYRAKGEGVAYVMFEDLEAYADDLIVLSGGMQGYINKAFAKGDRDAAYTYAKRLKDLYKDRFYMEITRLGLVGEANIENEIIDLVYAENIPLVATNQAFFLDKELYEAHDALLCIAAGRYIAEGDRPRVTPHHRFKSPEEMVELFKDLPEAVENTLLIAQRCAFILEPQNPKMPRFPCDISEEEELKRQAEEGLEQRLLRQVFMDEMSDQEKEEIRKTYHERLVYELSIINQMGFPGYFLIVSDFTKWADSKDIPVGPGRGSGAGSLVAWSLKITGIDPIRFNLIFERFLNPERVSMPDFDIDFCQERRDEVIDYVAQRYGADRVAQIITFGKFQARMVVRDVGRVLQMPYGQVDRLSKMIPNNPTNPITLADAIASEVDIMQAMRNDPTVAKLMDIGLKLEGLYRHASTHAAGVVIGDKPLDEIVPLYYDPRGSMPVTQFNMKDVEQAGLVKFDFLGLKTLTVIVHTEKLVRAKGIDIDMVTIPLDDKKTFDLLHRCETVGVFQLEGAGMVDVLRKLKPERFEELIALVALYRPGPMDDIPRYLACRHGEEEVTYAHPMLKEILEETFGVMVYQEQVMQIAQVMAGYSLGAADLLRRAMGKKIKSEMDAQEERFINGATDNGVEREVAEKVFVQMAKFASYGFNKSHSAPYGLIAYQTAYLKANHPLEFMAATMSLDKGNIDKLSAYRQELQRMGLNLLQPDINLSQVEFTVDAPHNGVRYALSAIKNVGEAAMESIVAEREANGPYKDIWDFTQRIDSKVLNRRQLENLILAGAFDSLEPNRNALFEGIETIINVANFASHERSSAQASLFGALPTDALPAHKLPEAKPWGHLEKLQHEFSAIGFYLSSHPLDPYDDMLRQANILNSAQILQTFSRGTGDTYAVAGVVVGKKERTSKSGNKFAFITLSDHLGSFEITAFSEQLAINRDLFEPGQAIIVSLTGRVDGESVRLTVESASSLDDKVSGHLSTVDIAIDSPNNLERVQQSLLQIPQGSTKIRLIVQTQKATVTLDSGLRIKWSPELKEL
jgi:DNA polymerase-3 subunit alpha